MSSNVKKIEICNLLQKIHHFVLIREAYQLTKRKNDLKKRLMLIYIHWKWSQYKEVMKSFLSSVELPHLNADQMGTLNSPVTETELCTAIRSEQ